MAVLRSELPRLGLGHLVEHGTYDADGWPRSTGRQASHGDHAHACGPCAGRVDADCQVHGISNLHVAGSSVFPTGGYANNLDDRGACDAAGGQLKDRLSHPGA